MNIMQNQAISVATGLMLLACVGIIDYLVGYEVTFSLFYLAPVSFVAWYSSRRSALSIALVASALWVSINIAQEHYSKPYAPYLNFLLRLMVFVIVVWLLDALKGALKKEKEQARIDFLTGAASRLAFFEMLEMELSRSRRYGHPFVIAYIDLDNFKEVNDREGHEAGDEVLRRVVLLLRKGLRATDIVARLGGDEFALILTEMDENEAKVVFRKLQGELLHEMDLRNWPVTFSMGVLICGKGDSDAEHLVRLADDLMYAVKKNGKNAIRYAVAREMKCTES
jgi:diguanylate cyclase (GGDEF)-like protein